MADGFNGGLGQTRHRFRVRGPAGPGPDIYEELQTERLVDSEERRTTTVELSCCASCNSLIHKHEEAGGICAVCGLLLCMNCGKPRCELCGRLVCLDHTREFQGKTVCRTHGFFQVLNFILFGR